MKKLTKMIVLAIVTLAWHLHGQTATTPATQTSTVSTAQAAAISGARSKAANVLASILAATNKTPLEMYPPGYLDQLEGTANGTLPFNKMILFDDSTNASSRPTHLKAGDKANMKWLDATCLMGSPTSEAERNSDESQYTAIISYGFYMGNFEVTQDEYKQVMGSNPSYFTSANGYTDDLDRPVENITYSQAVSYCSTLTSQALAKGSIPHGWEYRLPTEAEWEYSCRANSKHVIFDVEGPQTVENYVQLGYYYYVGYVNPIIANESFNGDAALSYSVHNHSTTGQAASFVVQDVSGQYAYEVGVNPISMSIGHTVGTSDIFSYNGGVRYHKNYFLGFQYQSVGNGSGITMDNGDYFRVTSSDPSVFGFGNDIYGGRANFNDQYEYDSVSGTTNVGTPTVPYLNMTTNVGSYQANGFGLYDTHGNVAEWCQDWYGAYPTATTVDPQGPTSGSLRVVRGGSWADRGVSLRSAARLGVDPSTASSHIGFRIVLAPTTPDWKAQVQTQPPQRVYGIAPTKNASKNSLVLITHGWQLNIGNLGYPPPDLSPFYSLSNSIADYLSGNNMANWQIAVYNWTQNAWVQNPMDALNNATQEGINLGLSLAAQGWTHIHFIAHSAGAELIQVATEVVKARSPSTVVQCTFLDPYVGNNFSGQSTYGVGADWSDRYSVHGDNVNALGPYTAIPLDAAYNVDVTGLDPQAHTPGLFVGPAGQISCAIAESSHGWPITFYQNSITGTPTGYNGFGFPLSEEAGGLQNAITQYPVGNIASVTNLGTLPEQCTGLGIRQAIPVTQIDFTASPRAAQSTSGTVTPSYGTLTLITGSPAWISIVPTNMLPVNQISFDANYTSIGAGAAGLLTVMWGSSVIGSIDERMVGEGVAHYTFPFILTESNSTHVLSFRLDPFTNVQSTVVITNVALSQQGVTQPFSLSVTTNRINRAIVCQLTGEAGFDYGLQVTSDIRSTNWTQIAVLENTNGVVTFYDQNSTNYAQRFYRAVAPY